MPEAKTFLKEELNQKIPQKIISHFTHMHIEKDETVLAVFGSVSFVGIYSSILSTEDRLIYLNNSSLVPKTIVVLYTNISDVELNPENGGNYTYLVLTNGEKIKIDIKASNGDTLKLFEFLRDYRENGASYINEKIAFDKKYADRIVAISGDNNEKLIIRNEKTAVKIAAINKWTDEQKALNHEKINEVASSRSSAHYKLNYSSGINTQESPCNADILMDNFHQLLVIELANRAKTNIPFSDVKGSNITTDIEIPVDDDKNEYLYYLNINCILNGKDSSLVFSKMQTQHCTINIIEQLNYAIQHLLENSKHFIDRNAKYEQRDEKLAAEREVLLAKRADQIDQMKAMFHGSPNTDTNPQQTIAVQQPGNPTNTSGSPNNFDEIKKFKELLDMGVITQEEFDAKKKELLHL